MALIDKERMDKLIAAHKEAEEKADYTIIYKEYKRIKELAVTEAYYKLLGVVSKECNKCNSVRQVKDKVKLELESMRLKARKLG